MQQSFVSALGHQLSKTPTPLISCLAYFLFDRKTQTPETFSAIVGLLTRLLASSLLFSSLHLRRYSRFLFLSRSFLSIFFFLGTSLTSRPPLILCCSSAVATLVVPALDSFKPSKTSSQLEASHCRTFLLLDRLCIPPTSRSFLLPQPGASIVIIN